MGEVVQATEAGAKYFHVDYLCYAPELLTSEYAWGLILAQTAKGIPCYELSREVFESLADKENPQGILAVARRKPVRLEELAPPSFSWGIGLLRPQDPGNLGAILRTIDAVGASGLVLLESSADPTHPSAVRASMGTLFWYPVVNTTFEKFVHWARRYGFTLVGTSAHGSLDYRSMNRYTRPLALLMGSEREGLGPKQIEACDQVIRLPMAGRATSLNLAVAAGIMLYDIWAKLEGTESVKKQTSA